MEYNMKIDKQATAKNEKSDTRDHGGRECMLNALTAYITLHWAILVCRAHTH